MTATFYWKWFSFHIVQLASNDNKNTYFREKNTSYAKSNCVNITALPNCLIFSVIKSSPQCWMKVEYASKTKCHERKSFLFSLCAHCSPVVCLAWSTLTFPCQISRAQDPVGAPLPCSHPLPKGTLRRTQSLPSSRWCWSQRPTVATGCPNIR